MVPKIIVNFHFWQSDMNCVPLQDRIGRSAPAVAVSEGPAGTSLARSHSHLKLYFASLRHPSQLSSLPSKHSHYAQPRLSDPAGVEVSAEPAGQDFAIINYLAHRSVDMYQV